MSQWTENSAEDRALFNPAFCAHLIWHFGTATRVECRGMSFIESFLLLPMVLHRSLRESLPRSARTSLHVWLDENPTFQAITVARSKAFMPITKSAILFGGTHQIFEIRNGIIVTNPDFKKSISKTLRASTEEVRICARKASFIGAWFSESGSSETIMAIMGVRP